MENTPETTGNEATNNNEGKLYTKEEVENRIRGVAAQVAERDRKMALLEASLAEIQQSQQARETAELTQKEEWKTLLEKERTAFQEREVSLNSELDTVRKTYESEKLDRKLEQTGITDDVIRVGIKAKLAADAPEDLDVYLSDLREKSPHLFSNAHRPLGVANAPAGVSHSPTNLSDEVATQWLKSSDPEKQKLANAHWRAVYFKE